VPEHILLVIVLSPKGIIGSIDAYEPFSYDIEFTVHQVSLLQYRLSCVVSHLFEHGYQPLLLADSKRLDHRNVLKHEVLIPILIKPMAFLDDLEFSVGNMDDKSGTHALLNFTTVGDVVVPDDFLPVVGEVVDQGSWRLIQQNGDLVNRHRRSLLTRSNCDLRFSLCLSSQRRLSLLYLSWIGLFFKVLDEVEVPLRDCVFS